MRSSILTQSKIHRNWKCIPTHHNTDGHIPQKEYFPFTTNLLEEEKARMHLHDGLGNIYWSMATCNY